MAWRTVQKKGESFFVVIPASIMKEFNLKKGDVLNFQGHKDQNYIHLGIVPPAEAQKFERQGKPCHGSG